MISVVRRSVSSGGSADWVSIGLALISAVSLMRTNPAPSTAPVPDDRLLPAYYTCRTTPGMWLFFFQAEDGIRDYRWSDPPLDQGPVDPHDPSHRLRRNQRK